jgi:cell wall assembly regulator SMI1
MRRDIERTWGRILAWHRVNGATKFELAEGASAEAIARVEKEMGVALPEDVRISWELHDGGKTESAWILSHGDLLSIERIGALWSINREMQDDDGWGLGDDYRPERRDPRMKPIWWSKARIPLTDNGGNGLHVDLDPTFAGTRGQILEMDHEIGPERVLAPSWSRFLETWADELEAGEYAYDPTNAWVTERASLPGPVLRRKLVHPSGATCVVELSGEWLSIMETSPTGESSAHSSAPGIDVAKKQLRAEVARRLASGWLEALGP